MGSSDLNISPFAVYSSARYHRGALIWPAPVAAVLAGVSYGDWLRLGSGGLNVFQKWNFIEVSLGLSFFSDREPFPIFRISDHKSDFRNQRDTSIEAVGELKLFTPSRFELALTFARDYHSHLGNYLQLRSSIPVWGLLSIGVSSGWADSLHNTYLFGQSGINGSTHIEGGPRLFLPFLPYKGVLNLSYSYQKITQPENQRAELVREDDSRDLWSASARWQI